MVKIKLPRAGESARRHKKSRRKPPGGGKPADAPRSGRKSGARSGASGGRDRWLYGYHAVAEALRNPARRVERLLATPAAAERLSRECPSARPEIADRAAIEAVLPAGAVHQGLALLAAALPVRAIEEILPPPDADALIVMLDQVTDPQNVGAILRSSAAFGVRAVLVPRRHAPPVTGALAKAASGALEHVPLIEVGNLERALQTLKEAGFWCIGLDGAAEQAIDQPMPGGRLVLVMGAEGPGLRRLTAERCDLLVRLPTHGPIATLNVSNAAAVALYALARRRDD
jgi:23S rRNA (guanosine2251-2'-O)-methyltransferase